MFFSVEFFLLFFDRMSLKKIYFMRLPKIETFFVQNERHFQKKTLHLYFFFRTKGDVGRCVDPIVKPRDVLT